jgi:hypothetical protein
MLYCLRQSMIVRCYGRNLADRYQLWKLQLWFFSSHNHFSQLASSRRAYAGYSPTFLLTMTFPSNSGAMSDPDPSTQMAWPTSRRDESMSPEEFRAPLPELLPNNGRAKPARDAKIEERQEEIGRKRLTSWDLFCLSISMLGAQIVWTVELGCVTVMSAQCTE